MPAAMAADDGDGRPSRRGGGFTEKKARGVRVRRQGAGAAG